ncbi:glutathione S-transferase N-terminal domain-containing protein [Chitinibacter sp. S2-10]|uniref:glutathione S-transferase N-terminal domain-containing protein n=1 Tax=Chitinibacter sp. S2-10 TaxID=3373597 RepID=UPI0039773696
MNNTDLPILYSFRRCPYAIRARLALWLGGVTVQLREIALRDKPAALLAISPKATVPVLLLPNGQVLEESLDIMRWVLSQSSAQSGPLAGIGTDLDRQLALILLHDQHFKPLLDRYKYPERHPELSAAEHQYHAMYWLKANIEHRLDQYTHLMDDQLRLADLVIAPFIRQYAAVDRDAFSRLASPALQNWLKRMLDAPYFAAVMEKYPLWQEGAAPVIFGNPNHLKIDLP